jgi:hypothetical protein
MAACAGSHLQPTANAKRLESLRPCVGPSRCSRLASAPSSMGAPHTPLIRMSADPLVLAPAPSC